MAEDNAVKCVTAILGDRVLSTDDLRTEILEVTRYLEQICMSLADTEDFLGNCADDFIVENDRVAAYTSHLDSGREEAAEYFESELKKEIKKYGEYPTYQNFRGHVGQAERNVIDYINSFYPEEEFKFFLEEYPSTFVVFKEDDEVHLTELECVKYFQQFVNTNSSGVHITTLQRHVTHYTPNYIRDYINECYEDCFLEFFEDHSNYFYVEDNYVYPS